MAVGGIVGGDLLDASAVVAVHLGEPGWAVHGTVGGVVEAEFDDR
jgi:hypothetical protein